MFDPKYTCFLCFTDNKDLIYHNLNDISVQHLEYIVPELELDTSAQICPDCQDKIASFYEFKKMCLENGPLWQKLLISEEVEDQEELKLFISDEEDQPEPESIKTADSSFSDISTSANFIQKEESSIIEKDEDIIVYQNTKLEAESNNELINDPQKIENADLPPKVQCFKCNKYFMSKNYLRLHLKQHERSPDVYCRRCDKYFTSVQALNKHEKLHNSDGDYFECSMCDKKFLFKSKFKSHMKTHTETNLECPTCKKKFKTMYFLKAHIAMHSNKTDFECIICEKKYFARPYLVSHMRRHVQAKKFKCEVCCKQFFSERDLKNHSRGHSNDIFECNVCKKVFKRRGLLNRHAKTCQK